MLEITFWKTSVVEPVKELKIIGPQSNPKQYV